MSKLFKLKEWLTLEEAASHISDVLGESFTLTDIYQFALSGHLVLSVNFVNNVKAKKVTFTKKEDIKYKKEFFKNVPNISEGAYVNVPINAQYPISRNLWVKRIEEQVFSLVGVWDLAMVGTEKYRLKQLYQQEISSDIEVKVPDALNVYVKGAEDTYQLQLLLTMEEYRLKHNNLTVDGMKPRILNSALAYPANRLDEVDHDLVMKVKEVTRFIKSLEDTPEEVKPLHDKERTTLLLLLGSVLKKANFDINERGVASNIRKATESNATPISLQTILDLLPLLRDVVELKQR
jgi:hypothetical protein